MKKAALRKAALVLAYAVQAPGNRQRFEVAGLISDAGRLAVNWQDGFTRLAVLRKGELRAAPGAFLANASDVVYRGKTSGTTSDALTYFAGERWNHKRVEARARAQRWWGLGETPVVNVASRLGPVSCLDSSLVGPVDYGFLSALLTIVGNGPIVLRGYPSRLCEVAIALHRNQLSLPANAVVAVVATGECLFEVQRALLHKTFNAPVVNEYGCQESGISGMSCPEVGRIHLDEDRCLYEIIDGELVTTDLWNLTMPMVRYVSGDAIALYPDPCPCGRAGLTAKILGRQDTDSQKLANQKLANQKLPGTLEMPAFSGLLNYQIEINGSHRRVRVQPENVLTEKTLQPLKQWFETRFGQGNTEVLVASPFADDSNASAKGALDVGDLLPANSETWLRRVTQQAWSGWIEQPLPVGAATSVAALLQQIVMPRQMVGRGVSQDVLNLMHEVEASELTADPALEAMRLRVLLWAVSLLTERGLSAKNNELDDIFNRYLELLARFETWCHRCDNLSDFSALGFDLLAPLLTLQVSSQLPRQSSQRNCWCAVRRRVLECWPDGIRADRFTVHHYLTILDIAGQNAQRSGHVWATTLRPLSALLLGDFYRVAASLSLEHVDMWAGIVHGQLSAFTGKRDAGFEETWWAFRRSLLQRNKTASFKHLSRLFELAGSKQEIARCWLEKGYANLVFEERFIADEWLEILSQQIGVLNPAGKAVSNPMAWSPILKALSPELIKSGKSELAYACLFAAAPPNRQMSGFDRLSVGVNGKQSVISIA
ncbi:MAG: hypothetical protein AAF703_14200 [Cyanobacteria bacterium P01_D01_bin.105]